MVLRKRNKSDSKRTRSRKPAIKENQRGAERIRNERTQDWYPSETRR